MNMIRDLLTLGFLALGAALWFGDPPSWQWPNQLGPYAVEFITYASDGRPWSFIVCAVLALSLFLTRLRY